MAWLIVLFLLFLWILGLATGNTVGGLIHFFFMIALLLIFNRLVWGPAALLQKRGDGIHRQYKKP